MRCPGDNLGLDQSRGHSVTRTLRALLCGRLDYAGPDQQVPCQDMGIGGRGGLWRAPRLPHGCGPSILSTGLERAPGKASLARMAYSSAAWPWR